MPSHPRPFRFTLLAAALSAALAAQARQQRAPAPMQRVEIKGEAETYDARRDDTASKIVLNRDDILKFGDTSVLEVLKRLPGVTVAGAAGRGGEVRMRGLGSGYTQVLLNGERAPAGFSIESLAPDAIERIEVLRAATAEFSTQAVAGSINIVLRKALKAAQRELKVGVGGGEGSFSPGFNVQLSDRKSQLSYSLSVNGTHSRNRRDTPSRLENVDPAGQSVIRDTAIDEDNRHDTFNLGPRLHWSFENGDTLTSQSFVNISRYQRSTDAVTTAASGTAVRYRLLDAYMANQNAFLRSDLNWLRKLARGATLEVKMGAVAGRLRNDLHRNGFSAHGGAVLLDSHVRSRGIDRGYNTVGKYATPIFAGHALSAGWDLGFSTRDDQRLQRERAADGEPPVLRPFNLDERYRADVTRLNAYVQDEWNVTPRWSLYMGMRVEDIATRISGSRFTDSETRSRVWSPILQTLYKLPGARRDQLRLALTRTYKAPSPQSLIPRRFASNSNQRTEPDSIGNPELKPELATGIDAAWERYGDKGALLSLSVYGRRLRDYTRSVTGLDTDGVTWVSKPVNSGMADTYGVELDAKFSLASLFKGAPAIDMRANMSRNWSRVDQVAGPLSRLDQQTPFSATIGADYRAGRLSAGTSYSFRNGGLVRVAHNQLLYAAVRRDLEGYAVWKFDPNNQLRAVLSNILHEDYVTENIFADAAGQEKRTTHTPQPVNVRLTWEMKF